MQLMLPKALKKSKHFKFFKLPNAPQNAFPKQLNHDRLTFFLFRFQVLAIFLLTFSKTAYFLRRTNSRSVITRLCKLRFQLFIFSLKWFQKGSIVLRLRLFDRPETPVLFSYSPRLKQKQLVSKLRLDLMTKIPSIACNYSVPRIHWKS